MKKEFFWNVLHSIVFKNEEDRCKENNIPYDFDSLWWGDTYSRADELSKKYSLLWKNLENNWKNELQVIPKDVFKNSVVKLINFVKKQPLNSDMNYWWKIKKSDIDFIEKVMEGNIDVFRRDMFFKTNVCDWFHNLYSHCYWNIWYLKILYRKTNLWVNEWFYIRNIIEYFEQRLRYIEDDKSYFAKKRKFKKTDKKLFLFNIQIDGEIDNWWDRFDLYKDDFNIVITHKSYKDAMDCLLGLKDCWDGINMVTGLIKEFCPSSIYNLSENKVKVSKIDITRENIEKAKDKLKSKYVKYSHYWYFNF